MSKQAELKLQYKNKILAVRNYKSDKNEFGVEDFIVLDIISKILEEVMNGESDLTPAGKVFLEAYYGRMELAKELASRGFNDQITPESAVYMWLELVEPMETSRFIGEARGDLNENATVKERLLPPES